MKHNGGRNGLVGQKVNVRLYKADDATPLGELMYTSVRDGTAAHYNQAQRAAWAPEPRSGDAWQQRLSGPTTYVAEDDIGLAGFITLAKDGYIDLAFVRPDRIGGGVALVLYQALEAQAFLVGITRLYCEASELAKPFFIRQGWELLASQTVTANGVTLRNHRMEKRLPPS